MSSLLNNAALLLNPAGSQIAYKEDKIYSVIPNNGDGDFTFNGGDGGTRVNQDGYIEVTPHNLLNNSNNFNSGWGVYTYNGGALSKNQGYPDPFGGNNAWLFEVTLGTGGILLTQNETIEEGVDYTLSVWMKGVVGGEKVQIDLRNTASSGYVGQLFTLTTKWVKYDVTVTNVSGTARGFQFRVTTSQASGDQDFYVYGAQLNKGNLRPYQPTTDRLNYPRITYQNGRGALLQEPARTNLYVGSQDFSIAYTKYQITLTANAAISPDGTQNATKFVDNTASGVYHQIEPSFSATSGVTYTMSVFVKAAEHTQFHIFAFADNGVFNSTDAVYDIAAGTVISGTGASIEKWPNGWFRCIRTLTSGATGTGYWGIGAAKNGSAAYAGDGSSGVYVWGAQNEAGEFASTYIPTTSTTVTRPIDQFYKNDSPALSSTSWTFYMSGVDIGKKKNSSGGNIDTVNWSFDSGNGPYGPNSLHNYNNTLYYYENTTPNATNLGNIGADTKKFAVTKTGNTFKLFRDGVLINTYTPTLQGNTWDSFRMYGNTDAQGQAFSNNPSTIAILPTNLSDAQAIELTTVRSGSGGNISYYGPYTIHTFTSSGTFTPSFSGEVEVLVVAGGGGGGQSARYAGAGGAGGAGGLVYASSYGVSQGTGTTVTIGAGGISETNGSNSIFGGLTALGGGRGGRADNDTQGNGFDGGSGGGGGGDTTTLYTAGSGTPGQGNDGGNGRPGGNQYAGGGGGGAGSIGTAPDANNGGYGGDGLPYSINGFSTYYAGGGGGGVYTANPGLGGLGGGGNGSITTGENGVPNTGGGGGGGGINSNNAANPYLGGTGGSGIVIIRYLT